MPLPYKLGDHGPEIDAWQEWFGRKFASYAPPRDAYYGSDEVRAVTEMQRRVGLPQTGRFDQATASHPKVAYPGYKPREHRPIWVYSAPGSGVSWDVGPPFDVGERCKKVLNLNHQPVGYAIGGYLGLMGGDPSLSYDDVIASEGVELERLLGVNPDVQEAMRLRRADARAAVAVELWFIGYSQSADGMKRAVARLFGPGGPYELLVDRINGVIVFGDPTTPGTGIARLVWTSPDWLNKLTHVINNQSPTADFYGIAADSIRPLFYEWFVKAETELPFVIYTGQIIIPALLNLVAPFLGGLAGGGLASLMAVPILAGASGVPAAALTPIVGGVLNARSTPNPDLIKLLSVQGILTNLPQLLGLLAAMPGIAVHGDYYAPKPEFGGRSGVDVAYDIVAGFRR